MCLLLGVSMHVFIILHVCVYHWATSCLRVQLVREHDCVNHWTCMCLLLCVNMYVCIIGR